LIELLRAARHVDRIDDHPQAQVVGNPPVDKLRVPVRHLVLESGIVLHDHVQVGVEAFVVTLALSVQSVTGRGKATAGDRTDYADCFKQALFLAIQLIVGVA